MSTQKKLGLGIGYSTSAATLGVGIGLMFTGPIGIVIGGILIGTGLSGGANTIQQNQSKEEKFSYSQFGFSSAIGAATGTIAAPFSIAAGALGPAGGIALESVGGAVSGAYNEVLTKASQNKSIKATDVLKAMSIGAISGGIGSSFGLIGDGLAQGVGNGVPGTVGYEIGDTPTTIARIGIKGTVQGTGGAIGSSIGVFIENWAKKGKVDEKDFISIFDNIDNNNKKNIGIKIWNFLINYNIVVNNVIQKKALDDKMLWDKYFPDDLPQGYKEYTKELLGETFDLTKGIGNAAVQGAVMGATMAAVSHMSKRHQLKKQVTKNTHSRANKISHPTKKYDGGSTEINAYVSKHKDTKVNVIVDKYGNGKDCSIQSFGNNNAKKEITVYFNEKGKHYSPYDMKNQKPINVKNHNPGDCLFEALSFGTKKTPLSVRQDIAGYMKTDPINAMKNVQIKDIKTGGNLIGGAKRDDNYTFKFDNTKAKRSIPATADTIYDYFDGKISKDSILCALDDLNKMRKANLKFVKNGRAAPHRIHRLHNGKISITLNPESMSSKGYCAQHKIQAGGYRVTFKETRAGLKLWGITDNHDYGQTSHNNLRTFLQNRPQ